MATTTKKTSTTKPKAKKEEDTTRSRIKPRGLWGLYEGRIHLNGTDDEVFSLNRLSKVQ
jgi:hypothetical protein